MQNRKIDNHDLIKEDHPIKKAIREEMTAKCVHRVNNRLDLNPRQPHMIASHLRITEYVEEKVKESGLISKERWG